MLVRDTWLEEEAPSYQILGALILFRLLLYIIKAEYKMSSVLFIISQILSTYSASLGKYDSD
jgi:hypothetical protein